MKESDKDYTPDEESFGDSSETAAKDLQLGNGKFKSLRNQDNEFVFDKEWAFKRMCTLQSLLCARLMSSNSRNFAFTHNSNSHPLRKKCSKENHALDEVKGFKSSNVNKNVIKKENNPLSERKLHTNDKPTAEPRRLTQKIPEQ